MIRSTGDYRSSAHSQTFNALKGVLLVLTAGGTLIMVPLVGHVGKQGWQKGFKLMLG